MENERVWLFVLFRFVYVYFFNCNDFVIVMTKPISFLRTGSYQSPLTFLALCHFTFNPQSSGGSSTSQRSLDDLGLTAWLSAKHTWPLLLCPQVLRPHVTVVEVAVCHPVHYIKTDLAGDLAPRWEPDLTQIQADTSWCTPPPPALWWSLVLYLVACGYPNITSVHFYYSFSCVRDVWGEKKNPGTQLSAGLLQRDVYLCVLGGR